MQSTQFCWQSKKKECSGSEDERLRSFAKTTYGVDGAWSQALLEQLLSKGKINDRTYQKLVIKLVLSNIAIQGLPQIQ